MTALKAFEEALSQVRVVPAVAGCTLQLVTVPLALAGRRDAQAASGGTVRLHVRARAVRRRRAGTDDPARYASGHGSPPPRLIQHADRCLCPAGPRCHCSWAGLRASAAGPRPHPAPHISTGAPVHASVRFSASALHPARLPRCPAPTKLQFAMHRVLFVLMEPLALTGQRRTTTKALHVLCVSHGCTTCCVWMLVVISIAVTSPQPFASAISSTQSTQSTQLPPPTSGQNARSCHPPLPPHVLHPIPHAFPH
jgi:hypothetical protein